MVIVVDRLLFAPAKAAEHQTQMEVTITGNNWISVVKNQRKSILFSGTFISSSSRVLNKLNSK